MIKSWAIISLAIAILGVFVWAIDSITFQGERTIYTARCQGGNWVEDACTGELVAADRYRFRALKAKNEVMFWTAGSPQPSGKLTQCTVEDGRNWSCKPSPDAIKSITLQIKKGAAIAGPTGSTLPFHAVSKWKWFLLRYGGARPGAAIAPSSRSAADKRVDD